MKRTMTKLGPLLAPGIREILHADDPSCVVTISSDFNTGDLLVQQDGRLYGRSVRIEDLSYAGVQRALAGLMKPTRIVEDPDTGEPITIVRTAWSDQ